MQTERGPIGQDGCDGSIPSNQIASDSLGASKRAGRVSRFGRLASISSRLSKVIGSLTRQLFAIVPMSLPIVPSQHIPQERVLFHDNRAALIFPLYVAVPVPGARFYQGHPGQAGLQRKGTRSAKRHLKKMRRSWSRFMRSANHLIANSILAGLAPGDTLVLEELTGIRDRCRHRKGQRGLFHRWSFFQLRSFLAYKAEQRGIQVLAVDPRNTSRTCPRCCHCDKANRKQQSMFCCQSCGYTANADYVAATNLRQKGIALLARPLSDGPSCQPPVSLFGTGTGLGASPQPSGGGI